MTTIIWQYLFFGSMKVDLAAIFSFSFARMFQILFRDHMKLLKVYCISCHHYTTGEIYCRFNCLGTTAE